MSRKLLQISGYFMNHQRNRMGLEIHLVPTDEVPLEPIAAGLIEALEIYDKGIVDEGDTPDEAAEHYLAQLDAWSVPVGQHHNMTYEEMIMALMNIHWLEQRGYLKEDNHNGLMFQYLNK